MGDAMAAINYSPIGRFGRIVTVAGILAVLCGATAGSSASAAVPAAVAGVRGSGDPLSGVLAYLRGRAGVAQVAVFDQITGRIYLLSDGPDPQYTASIVKPDIAAMWLRRYERRPGTIPANIPYSIRYLLTNMITVSDNVAATSLFYFGGGF